MNNNSSIRQIQIDLLTDSQNDTLDWFNELWSNIIVVEIDVFHNNGGEFLYYTNDDVIFYRDDNLNVFKFSSTYYSSPLFRLHHNYNFRDIRNITDLLINNVMGIIIKSKPFTSRGLGKARKVWKNYLWG